MQKIDEGMWLDFNNLWFRKFKSEGLRFGQAFCNHFNITDSDLFHDEDHIESVNKALVRYVDCSLPYNPTENYDPRSKVRG